MIMKNQFWLGVALMVLSASPRASANVYNVTSTPDGAGVVTSLGGGNFNASTLRAAVNAANAAAGPHTINVPPGTYTLTLGELPVGTNANLSVTINGTGTPANTIIQHDTTSAPARVFDLDSVLSGGVNVVIQNITIAHGRNNDGIGGAGIVAGYQGPPAADSTTISNCVLFDNLVIANTPDAVGGGLQNIGGTLKVLGCRFDGNSSSNFSGGAIYYDTHSPSTGTCQIANCTFTNNSSADPSSGGGAIFISGVVNSTLTLSNSLFTANKVTSSSGSGGAIVKFGGAPLIVSGCTFTNNQVLGNSATIDNASGGAIDVGGGPMTVVFSRFFNNTTAAAGHGNSVNVASASGATLVGNNNWWGVNNGPTASDLSGATVANWLKLTHYATPASIPEAGSTTLTASIVTNSAGTAIPLGNLGVLLGLPINFGNAVGGTISSPQTVIQPSGTATANYLMTASPTHTADATVDAATATAVISVTCPAINGALTGGATICSGNSANISVSISGGVAPYSVVLNNGGGSHVGTSPLTFTVSPSSTTTYSVSSATDAYGCPATVTGSATIMVSQVSSAITPSPAAVCANSTGNQASGAAGMTRYAWTISNGTITSATNTATITYSAGASGNVTLGLTVTNSTGCGATGSIAVPISPLPAPTITATPASVNADSPGNQASSPTGFASYAWTINNGTITSPTTGPNITYVAGPLGSVTLGLTVANGSGCSAATSINVPIISGPVSATGSSFRTNYFASLTFTNGLPATTMPIAFDGTNYWSCSGGTTTGLRLARYDTNGVLLSTYAPGLDFRSVFTDGTGLVLARAYSDRTIYLQSTPGVFVASGVTLNGGTLDAQSSVVLNGSATEYIAMSAGVVSRWDTAGNYLGAVNLQGFGIVSGENGTPQSHSLATFGDFWLTYNGAGILSVWEATGTRLAQITLSGAGTSSDSSWGFSYCNGKAFVVDSATGLWRGFDVGSPGRVAIYGAPGNASWNADVQSKIIGTGQLPQVDASLVSGANPVPALAELRRYESVLVYSDTGFNNNTNIGNNLADYVDLGGGVVLNTFVFDSSGGLSIQGRLVTGGYLPFTTASYTTGNGLTLVKDQPAHPIYAGVSTLNGGTASYHNSSISTAAGATQLGHWTDNQPLVAVKDITLGRTTGLNFYPPSADVLPGSWATNTDGGRLMANALLYAGKVAPVIMQPPTNSVIVAGGTVSFNVAAVGLPPLTYQWRKSGTNIAGATNPSLNFPMVTNSTGLYTVVVSNSYGLAVSSKAVLNLPLRILPPALGAGGALPLFVGTTDGSPLTADRASRIRIYTSANVGMPLSNWTQLSAPLVFSNGLLRVDGISATNALNFYRAAEKP
jgi:hypothetical protein